MKLPRSWYWLGFGALGACATSTSWTSIPEPSAPRTMEQLTRARSARDALASELMNELTSELSANGPASAIDVCARRAPLIADRIGREHDLRIGRTSTRLRNPDNQAPTWATAVIASDASEAHFFTSSDGALGVLLPIRMQSACTACHGAPSTLDASVSAALASRYPADRATGFAVGDLRGWFWIEVP